jgi:hypothetical protein
MSRRPVSSLVVGAALLLVILCGAPPRAQTRGHALHSFGGRARGRESSARAAAVVPGHHTAQPGGQSAAEVRLTARHR